MHPTLRFVLAAMAAAAFCIGIASAMDWRVMLAIKLVPVVLALDWLRVAGLAGRYRRWIAVGLALSLVGDALLALPQDLFIAGLVAFLLAHVAYVTAFLTRSRSLAWPSLLAAAALVLGYLSLLDTRGTLGAMRGPVGTYAAVIGVMLWRAASLGPLDRAGRWALAGAVLFVASDMLLAWNRFVAPDGDVLRHCASILLYWAGQWGIAASAVRARTAT